MDQHRRHATMAVERRLESLTADRLRHPGDQPHLAGVLGRSSQLRRRLHQKGGWIGSVVPLDPVRDRPGCFSPSSTEAPAAIVPR